MSQGVALGLCLPKTAWPPTYIYRGKNLGEGKKSMAFSLVLADPKAELAPDQVDRAIKKILGNLKYKLNIEIR